MNAMSIVRHLLVVSLLLVVGCSTSVKSTLQTAQQECDQMVAIISNDGGTEGVRIRCTWTVDEVNFNEPN